YCSQIANQGVHFLDAIRWSLGETAPASVCAMGGKFVVDDDRTIPDTLNVCFQFASGRLIHFCHYEGNGNPIMATDANYRPLGFLELRGTNGTMYVYDNRYLIKAEQPGQFQEKGARIEEEEYSLEGTKDGNANITTLHAQNFLDCMRSRELPNTDVEEGHRSTTMSLLANISLATGLRLEWDAEKERITNNDKANEFLSYEYRAPWKLEI
ncbi:MAG: gfo/Idh/MocA family oxidoreductase, partial [Thermoguttaceae bacterium]|nr:gfo/Idh/MocA family oxidoreductase [Thermoguttaceae bacterium]